MSKWLFKQGEVLPGPIVLPSCGLIPVRAEVPLVGIDDEADRLAPHEAIALLDEKRRQALLDNPIPGVRSVILDIEWTFSATAIAVSGNVCWVDTTAEVYEVDRSVQRAVGPCGPGRSRLEEIEGAEFNHAVSNGVVSDQSILSRTLVSDVLDLGEAPGLFAAHRQVGGPDRLIALVRTFAYLDGRGLHIFPGQKFDLETDLVWITLATLDTFDAEARLSMWINPESPASSVMKASGFDRVEPARCRHGNERWTISLAMLQTTATA